MADTIKTTKVTSNKQVGDTNVVQRQVQSEIQQDPNEFSIAKSSQVIWFIAHFIAGVLSLRFLFLLLGANPRGFFNFIYSFGDLLILPFRGVFPSAQSAGSYFDTASLLAIVMYYLFALLITKAIALMSKETPPIIEK